MSFSANVDDQHQMYVSEAHQMHADLKRTNVGRYLQEFIALTTEFKMSGRNVTSQGVVMTISKLLLACLSNISSRQRAGLVTKQGRIPKYIVVAEIMGKRVSLWSESRAVLREIVACFYNPTPSGIGQQSLMRAEIDRLCRINDDENKSYVLVLASPWGCSINDRFWRFFSVRQVSDSTDGSADSRLVNSEECMVSFQVPPALESGSNECLTYNDFSDADVKSFCDEYKSVCIDECEDVEIQNNTPASNESVSDRRYKVMEELLSRLKNENASLQTVATRCNHQKERDRAQIEKYREERNNLYCDIDSYRKSLEMHSEETTRVTAALLSFREEIREMEREMGSVHAALIEKNGEILVLQDAVEEEKTARSEELEKLKESLRRTQSALNFSQGSVKQDSERSRENNKYIKKLESNLESNATELARMTAEMDTVNRQAQEAKKTSTDTIGKLMDSNAELRATIKSTKSNFKAQKRADRDSQREAKIKGLVFVARLVRLRSNVQKEQAQLKLEKQLPVCKVDSDGRDSESEIGVDADDTASTHAAKVGAALPYPANAVASAKRCISELSTFIGQAASGNHQTVAFRASSPANSPTYAADAQVRFYNHNGSPYSNGYSVQNFQMYPHQSYVDPNVQQQQYYASYHEAAHQFQAQSRRQRRPAR